MPACWGVIRGRSSPIIDPVAAPRAITNTRIHSKSGLRRCKLRSPKANLAEVTLSFSCDVCHSLGPTMASNGNFVNYSQKMWAVNRGLGRGGQVRRDRWVFCLVPEGVAYLGQGVDQAAPLPFTQLEAN